MGGSKIVAWVENPFALISWWEMEKFSAEVFYELGRLLKEAEEFVDWAKSSPKDLEKQKAIAENRLRMLALVIDHCEEIGLSLSGKFAKRFSFNLRSNVGYMPESIKQKIAELGDRVRDEMGEHLFMHIPPDRAKRYASSKEFGDPTVAAFPSAKFDMYEAGCCYASARYTACVFHLMRTLEVGLSSFAKVFGVASDHTNWHNIIEGIEKKVREMGNDPNRAPDWKEKQESYAQIATSFMFFKDAWRNYTAHARGKYTEEEADGIYRNVCSFMQKLVNNGLGEQLELSSAP